MRIEIPLGMDIWKYSVLANVGGDFVIQELLPTEFLKYSKFQKFLLHWNMP
jgi:hypothetical protein